uniref:Uncharacterized protein n=1 Tax=viral metagenome TaxID=1070528 RepID=A0A6M3LPM2_9ZZZZ
MNEQEWIEFHAKEGINKNLLKWFLAYAKSGNLDYQTIDISSEIDTTLTYHEQKAILKAKFPISNIELIAKDQASKIQIEHEEQQANLFYLEHLKQEQETLLTTISNDKEQKTEQYFFIAKHYVKSVIEGHTNCAILYSQAGGLGKTHLVLSTLNEQQKKLNQEYVLTTGYTTPLEFYNQVYKNKDKLIICDDVEGLFTNVKGLALIKQMTWGTAEGGKKGRVVEYETTSKMRTAPEKFEFTGRLIFCLNHLPFKNPALQPVLSRVLLCRLEFSYATKKQILLEIAKSPYKDLSIEERNNIVETIFKHSDETTIEFNLRTLIKAYDLYLYSQKSLPIFEILAKELLTKDDDLTLIKQLMSSDHPVSYQITEYKNQTGKSRASFFRSKKKIEQSLKVSNLIDVGSETFKGEV